MICHIALMKKQLICLAVFGLAACNTPSIPFRGVTPTTVTVEGSTFDVRIRGLHAEAIRTNMQYAPRLGAIGKRAEMAIEQVSGCRVARSHGDQSVTIATIDCGHGAPKLWPKASELDCYNTRDVKIADGKIEDLTIDCTSY